MEIGAPAWRHCLEVGSLEMIGRVTTEVETDRLTRHVAEMIRWNQKTNLTAITNPEDVAVKHILDSMAPIPYLPVSGSLLDIGSGGGFPGMVLKILRPTLGVTMIDASRKKVSFLMHVIRMLGLKDARAIQHRAEALSVETAMMHHFDIVVSRALCELDAFVALALPFTAPKGMMIALKGKPEETAVEMARLNPGANRVFDESGLSMTVADYQLPHLNVKRTLVLFRR